MATEVDKNRDLKDLTLQEIVLEVKFRTSDAIKAAYSQVFSASQRANLYLGEAEDELTRRIANVKETP